MEYETSAGWTDAETDSLQVPAHGGGLLTLALPKGRLFEPAVRFLRSVGIAAESLDEVDRALVVVDRDARLRFLLVRPSDVVAYVAEGAADLGIVGKDTLLEEHKPVYEMYDLGFGACHLAVAAPEGRTSEYSSVDAFYRSCGPTVRVASKYPTFAESHFASRGLSARIIPLRGSVELAPLVGLADVILDLVSSGRTLRANGLVECEKVADITARLVVNPVSLKVKHRVGYLLSSMRRVTSTAGEGRGNA